ncbi:MAG: threonylcarbamoyl-AMP synthase [Candidatus Competibacteraceae bacterium]|uniref:L-threonylcarbamoyladenylate synthase n=1 Tax=Candidatus Contendibacter odensensis TaxID=1400860 RepID=UPI0004AE1DC8|nr:L-threonylcarbamoyladenylate synthase [Candidatus Contendobacter odensis]MBK8535007.1 threonylcarbamoyl-AMP synthase [Candidatus Competibacteraceae bacterium]MBK8753351.1 threonylcarbamoyl-AMP synthase [Candidatus Competibacteraceae bacterium]
MNPLPIKAAVRVIRAGGLIACPTEAVYGLGCDPRNEQAVQKLLTLKRRPMHKGLILIAADFAQLAPFLQPLSSADFAQLAATWPGPHTWLIPARTDTPRWLRGRHDTLAVRVTAHLLAAALCRACGHPLVSTSANFSRRPPARTALAVRRQLGRQIDYLLPGPTGGAAKPTEIRDLRSGQRVRA